MRLSELYRGKRPDISIELFPPKTPEAVEKLFGETIPRLKRLHPAFFSMTYGAAGSTRDLTLDLCNRMKNELKVETTCHLNIIGQSRDQTRANLQRLKEMGVYNLLALRGDPPKDQPHFKPYPDGFTSSVELIKEARKITPDQTREPWFSIAVTGFPEVHPEAKDRASDIGYLKKKIEAGGCVVITQLFLDVAYFSEFMEEVKKAQITLPTGEPVPVVPGILPIISVAQLRRFAALCGSKIPPAVEKGLSRYENDEEGATQFGIECATQMCQELLRSGVKGLHFYALNRALSTETILTHLGL